MKDIATSFFRNREPVAAAIEALGAGQTQIAKLQGDRYLGVTTVATAAKTDLIGLANCLDDSERIVEFIDSGYADPSMRAIIRNTFGHFPEMTVLALGALDFADFASAHAVSAKQLLEVRGKRLRIACYNVAHIKAAEGLVRALNLEPANYVVEFGNEYVGWVLRRRMPSAILV